MVHSKITVNRWNFVKTGALLIALGICFLLDRNFFFWPPSLAPAWNSIWVDSIGLACGVIMAFIGITGKYTDFLVKLVLGVSAAFLTVLLIAEMFHIVGVGYYRFHPAVIFEIYAIVNLMQMAYEYVPKDQN